MGVKSIDLQLLELEKIYRQTDKAFIDVLNRIRNNSVTDDDLYLLNNRVVERVESSSNALEVILTPTTRLNGSLYVHAKSRFGFEVREINAQDEGGMFDWMVIARKKGGEDAPTGPISPISPIENSPIEPTPAEEPAPVVEEETPPAQEEVIPPAEEVVAPLVEESPVPFTPIEIPAPEITEPITTP